MTSKREHANQDEALVSPSPRWPWWLTGTSPRQVLAGMVPTVLISVAWAVADRPRPLWLQWLLPAMIHCQLGCAVASVVALRLHPSLKNATHQRRPLGRSTRHRYAVSVLLGIALVLIAALIAVVTKLLFAWLVLAVIAVLTMLSFTQLGRPLLEPNVARTRDSRSLPAAID